MANKPTTAVQPRSSDVVDRFCTQFARDIETAATATSMNAAAFRASLIAEAQRNPDVVLAMREAPESVLHCCVQALQLGLLVGAAHGEAYLVPRNQKHGSGWRKVLTLMTGYKGLLRLSHRVDGFLRAHADVVYLDELSTFSWDRDGKPHHPFTLKVDRSDDKIVAAYAWVERLVSGRVVVDSVVLEREQILARRDRSDAWKAYLAKKVTSNPWATDFPKMCRKSPIRDLIMGGTTPIQREVVRVLAAEEELDIAPVETINTEPLAEKAPRTRVQALEDRLAGTVVVDMPAQQEAETIDGAGADQAEAGAEAEAEAPRTDPESELRAAADALREAAAKAGLKAWVDLQRWLQDETGRAISKLSDLTIEEARACEEKLKS